MSQQLFIILKWAQRNCISLRSIDGFFFVFKWEIRGRVNVKDIGSGKRTFSLRLIALFSTFALSHHKMRCMEYHGIFDWKLFPWRKRTYTKRNLLSRYQYFYLYLHEYYAFEVPGLVFIMWRILFIVVLITFYKRQ